MKILENISKFIALGSSVIIFLSILKHSLYYGQFGITIIHYISLTELIPLFLNDIIVFVVFFCIVLLIVALERGKIKEPIKQEDNNNIFKKYERYIIPMSILVLIGVYSTGVTIYKAYKGESSITTLFYNGSVLLLVFALMFLLKMKGKISNKEIAYFAQYTLILGLILSTLAFAQAEQIKNYNPRMTYKIVQKESEFQTDKTIVFVGRTEKYFFLFNRKTKTTRILKTDDIKEIHISALK